MGSKRTTLTNHIKAFRSEALMLLRFQLASNRIQASICNSNYASIRSRADLTDLFVALKAIENDLIVRVCKFDDNRQGVHSFPKAILEIPKEHLNKTEIENKTQEFSSLINEAKTIRRHTQLAHLGINSKDNQYDIQYNLTPAIKLIVDIIDLMNNNKVNYYWKEASEKLDLRKEVLNEEPENTAS